MGYSPIVSTLEEIEKLKYIVLWFTHPVSYIVDIFDSGSQLDTSLGWEWGLLSRVSLTHTHTHKSFIRCCYPEGLTGAQGHVDRSFTQLPQGFEPVTLSSLAQRS